MVRNAVESKVHISEALGLGSTTVTQNRQGTGGNSNLILGESSCGPQVIDEISRSLDLIARLWLTINFDTLPLGQMYPNPTQVAWEDNKSLNQAIKSQFAMNHADSNHSVELHRGRIPSAFNMAILCERYNFSIRWTHNLADHLRIDGESGKITVTLYEHIVCLWNHLQYSPNCPIPQSLLEETLDSLILLFPYEDPGTMKFLKRENKNFWRLGRCGRTRKAELDDFFHWKQNIRRLLREYDQPPRGTQQLRLDREGRNFLEFSTFWTALAVAILTILGIAFGTIGTAYAIKAYNLSYKQYVLSQKQYELDLVQACADPEAAKQWPEFCGS
ncbi:hypothetical protein CORC01_14274 [Colletotrichum orchidophilum]|uniref:Uncharacterized protein n=1 Tax=Colletotrichum orchidophilum TaxID=1209926 RepID=A0A1G4AN22_9PEZI|nr:uncharacterized protein CORC01_14274 [Colletotrichum orchidophilum]OHE90432.1 hypothetical protein CORC01_14274 [Colletotrichum orchidophilum]